MANGMFRRGFSISSPMAEPDSTPPNAKKTLDQNMALSSDLWGMRLATEKCVAEPKRAYESAARMSSAESGMMLPRELMLFSHLPKLTPRMLSRVMMASQK